MPASNSNKMGFSGEGDTPIRFGMNRKMFPISDTVSFGRPLDLGSAIAGWGERRCRKGGGEGGVRWEAAQQCRINAGVKLFELGAKSRKK